MHDRHGGAKHRLRSKPSTGMAEEHAKYGTWLLRDKGDEVALAQILWLVRLKRIVCFPGSISPHSSNALESYRLHVRRSIHSEITANISIALLAHRNYFSIVNGCAPSSMRFEICGTACCEAGQAPGRSSKEASIFKQDAPNKRSRKYCARISVQWVPVAEACQAPGQRLNETT